MFKQKQFGRYTAVELIGSGDTTSVFRAVSGDEEVVLKMLHSHLVSDEVISERFRREVRIAERLDHPGIVNIYDLVSLNNELGIVMEYCSGGNLEGWKTEDPQLFIQQIQQISEALDYAHSNGVIHGDLKPENLLVSAEGKIRISDFGSAHLKNLIGLTTSSMFTGTPRYIPPEVFAGYIPAPSADIYSLGVILYQAAAGKASISDLFSPFSKSKPALPPLSELNPDIPEWLSSLILKMCDSPDKRPSSFKSIIMSLKKQNNPDEEKVKLCIYCGTKLPESFPVCINCGKKELIIEQCFDDFAETIVLKKISEKSGILHRFIVLLKNISGNENLSLNILTDDIRLYSKEEKKRGTKLPARIIDNLLPETSVELIKLFENAKSTEIGLIRYKMKDMMKKRGLKNQKPLIIPKKGVFRLYQGNEDLTAAVGKAVVIENDRLKKIFTGIADRCFRIENRDSSQNILNLISLVQDLIKQTDRIEEYLNLISLGEIYSNLQRIEDQIINSENGTEIDDLIKQKMEQTKVYEKYEEYQREHILLYKRILDIKDLLKSEVDFDEIKILLKTVEKAEIK